MGSDNDKNAFPGSTGTSSKPSGAPASGGGTTGVNPDKAIARLLYAMLKQKSLKDIDWNQVARDPVLLEEISNGHAARMRYSRFRASAENNKTVRKVSGSATTTKVATEEAKRSKSSATSSSSSISQSKSNRVVKRRDSKKLKYKPARSSNGNQNGDDRDDDDGYAETDAEAEGDREKEEERTRKTKSKDHSYGKMKSRDRTSTDSRLFNPQHITRCDPDMDIMDIKVDDGQNEDPVVGSASFTSSLPSPPTELIPAMEPEDYRGPMESMESEAFPLLEHVGDDRLTVLKRRKMMLHSPTIKAEPLHLIPKQHGYHGGLNIQGMGMGTRVAAASGQGLIPGSGSGTGAGVTTRIHSMPLLSSQQHNQNSHRFAPLSASNYNGGVMMMRHHSAGSPVPSEQMLRTTRLLTPSSDDFQHHQFGHQHLVHQHAHTQPPVLRSSSGVGDHEPFYTFSHPSCTNNNTNTTAVSTSITASATPSHTPQWTTTTTPYTSPHMADTFDMSPYVGATTALDFSSNGGSDFPLNNGGGGDDGMASVNANTSLFAMVGEPQSQHQQNMLDNQTFHTTYMMHALAKHSSNWDAMIGQGGGAIGGSSINSHSQGHHAI